MKRYFWLLSLLLPLQIFAQDSTINDLTKGMDEPANEKKAPVKIFSTEKTINANTTQMVGKGKMDFRITHNFDDIDGKGGLFGRFLGLDNARDVRIGFHIGLTDWLDVHVARVKGAGTITNSGAGGFSKVYELAFKFLLAQQRENDPKHPLSVALFVNSTVATSKAISATLPNFEGSFKSFSDRLSQAVQLIVARKFGKVSLQLNPTFVHTNYVVLNDDNSMFALGGALRIPMTRSLSLIVDYFHPFRSASSKTYYKTADPVYSPPGDVTLNRIPVKFHDPLGIGFEITTAGHVFNLNFTNAAEILENRFIPYTNKSWSSGGFRWGFTISRKFVLWREKK